MPFPDAGRFRPIFVAVAAPAICGINGSVYSVEKGMNVERFPSASTFVEYD
jgi:hypothetical protein